MRTATVSGQAPPLASRCAHRMAAATSLPRCRAAWEGMRYGSRAWMLRPDQAPTRAPTHSTYIGEHQKQLAK